MNKISFLQLMDEEIQIDNNEPIQRPYIKIPLIQRDYVEGRKKSNGKLEGENFLNSIFDSIQEKELMLDYIYGNVKREIDGNFNFIPLDGQQRLTTLFLLYWYIGNIELKGEKYESLMKSLRRFSYETRVTAKDFCKMLCDMGQFKIKDVTDIKKFIQGKKEFYYDYNLDPTIQNMLEVLSKIEDIYRNKEQKYYDKLDNIKFDLLIMENYGLTDELYIKMNARGKKLTDFENFKADFIDFMNKKINNQSFNIFGKLYKYNGEDCFFIEKISWKFDNEWLDALWRNVCNENNGLK